MRNYITLLCPLSLNASRKCVSHSSHLVTKGNCLRLIRAIRVYGVVLAHAECNGCIAGNWNLVKLLLSTKEIERYRVCKHTCTFSPEIACISSN